MMSGEPTKSKTLLKLLAAWELSDEILPNVDQDIEELDAVELPETELNEQAVLGKAVIRTAGFLGLPDDILATILSISPATVDQLKRGDYLLSKDRPEWESGILIVRLHILLDAVAGTLTKTWILNNNTDFDEKRPIDVIQSTGGLAEVCGYLEMYADKFGIILR